MHLIKYNVQQILNTGVPSLGMAMACQWMGQQCQNM